MMIATRLRRLEQAFTAAPGGCPACRAWPTFLVTWPDQQRSDAYPERCPRCGRCRTEIAVTYYRAETARGTHAR